MATPVKRASHVFTISFPEELANQVIAAAREESRTISELFREAFRTYRRQAVTNFVSAPESPSFISAEGRMKVNSRQ